MLCKISGYSSLYSTLLLVFFADKAGGTGTLPYVALCCVKSLVTPACIAPCCLYFLQTKLEGQVHELKMKIQGLQVDLDNSEAVQRDFVKLSQSLQVSGIMLMLGFYVSLHQRRSPQNRH